MKPFWFWFCMAAMMGLNWIPGYCRYYVLGRPERVMIQGVERMRMLRTLHWEWRWQALWGFRLVCRLGMIGAFQDELGRRSEQENPSSAS